ncbi:phage tail tape measure protein [Paenibacillus sp. FSL M7-0802]|uniref:phage tail tape measure protein n=1 Tax=Paenibacillus TaxID=44249 RepID=UPI002223776B|nr:phage tail tape measure protein [Paenibacillus polymyxa]
MSFDLIGHLRLKDDLSSKLSRAMGGMMKFGAVAAGLGTAVSAVAIAGDSLKKAMDFESQMSTIKALTGATDTQMKQMQQLALQQGSETKYSALEASKAIEELLKAGMSTAQVQAGGLNASLNLATAGGLELAEAAETMATSMNAFKKDGLSAAQTANILAGTANAAATGVRDIGYGIASAGGVADMVGLSFKDLNTAIGLMSNDGLKSGSDAGTSFKSMLMYLQPQTKKATRLFEKLGIGVGKANKFFEKGKIKDLAGVADVLQKTLGKMSEQDRTATLLDMFSTDGVKAATTLYKAGSKGVKEFYRQMSNVTALQVAKEKMNNAAGSLENFRGAIETLQISALLPTMPIIAKLANAASQFVTKYTPQITAAVQKAVTTAQSYIKSNFINNPKFNKLPDLESKVTFVFDTLLETFNGWWNKSGRVGFETITSSALGVMIDVVEASAPQIASAALSVGQAIAYGVMKGIKEHFNLVQALNPNNAAKELIERQYSSYDSLKNSAVENAKNKPGKPLIEGGEIKAPPKKTWGEKAWGSVVDTGTAIRNFATGHAGGLDTVPYNGYPARLHKDEAVLTKHEASEWRDQQRGKGSNAPSIVIQNVTITNDMDVERFASMLARRLAI